MSILEKALIRNHQKEPLKNYNVAFYYLPIDIEAKWHGTCHILLLTEFCLQSLFCFVLTIDVLVLTDFIITQYINILFLHVKTDTVSPRSSDPFYLFTDYIKWVSTSWTYIMSPFNHVWYQAWRKDPTEHQ